MVMEKAAANLTPVTLELGGKSPCIIDKSANLKLTAKRLAFGKYLNCGQTCVAPDYVLVHEAVKEEFLKLLKSEIRAMYGEDPLKNPDYGKMINRKHFDRVLGLMKEEKLILGGENDTESLRIAPAVMDQVTEDDAVMQEEIFGPILPVLTYDFIDEAVDTIRSMAHPLALYIFTQDKCAAKSVIEKIGFGGGCINDTLIHLATSEMPFGGFGESGMGSYHAMLDDDAAEFLSDAANGDARAALNGIELAVLTTDRSDDGMIHITLDTAQECIQKRAVRYDKSGDNHYDTISAFIKSINPVRASFADVEI